MLFEIHDGYLHLASVKFNCNVRSTYVHAPVPFDSLIVLLTGHGFNSGSRSTSPLHTDRCEAQFEICDGYLRHTYVKLNLVLTYVKRNGLCTVHSAFVRGPFVRGPFNIRSIVV